MRRILRTSTYFRDMTHGLLRAIETFHISEIQCYSLGSELTLCATAGFAVLLIASAYLGLSNTKLPSYKQSDKGLHFITFFLLTLCFYWILETNRRRNLQLTLFVCPVVLGVGSEIAQGLLPVSVCWDRHFHKTFTWAILTNLRTVATSTRTTSSPMC